MFEFQDLIGFHNFEKKRLISACLLRFFSLKSKCKSCMPSLISMLFYRILLYAKTALALASKSQKVIFAYKKTRRSGSGLLLSLGQIKLILFFASPGRVCSKSKSTGSR